MEATAAAGNASQIHLDRKAAYLDRIAALSFEGIDWTAERIIEMRDFLGPWEHNIKLPYDIYTTNWTGSYPDHDELIAVVTQRLAGRFEGQRIVDLGCLEGYFTFECALSGAQVWAIDAKTVNVKKCEFVRTLLNADTCTVVQDDAMSVTRRKYGGFDVVLVLGLLYHLADPFTFLANMADVCDRFMVLDTHVALSEQPNTIKGGWNPGLSDLKIFTVGSRTYRGRLYREFEDGTSQLERDLSSTASLANDLSVWLTLDSLVALLRDVGFAHVEQVMYPDDGRLRWSGLQRNCRVLLIASKECANRQSRVL